jgi:hypothetical protein
MAFKLTLNKIYAIIALGFLIGTFLYIIIKKILKRQNEIKFQKHCRLQLQKKV